MKVFFVSIDGLCDPLGGSQILPYLEGLSQLGVQITVFSLEKPQNFKIRASTIQQICDRNHIIWHYRPYKQGLKFLGGYWNMSRLEGLLENFVSQEPFIIHARGYVPALLAQNFSKRYNKPWVFDTRGFWADERKDSGAWDQNSLWGRKAYQYFKNQEQGLLKSADRVICLTEKASDYLRENMGLNPFKTKIIPCCVDDKVFNILPRKPRTENEPLNLVYLGSWGTQYLGEEMFKFFKQILNYFPGSKFHIYSPGNKKEIFKVAAGLDIEENSVEVRMVERSNLAQTLSEMDLALSFIQPAFSKIASSPTKMAEYWACGLPVICNTGIGDIDQQCTGELGICKPLDSLESITKEEIMSLLSGSRENRRQFALSHYRLEKGVETYLEAYKEIATEIELA